MTQTTDLQLFSWRNSKAEVILKKWLPISISIGLLSGIIMSFFLWFIQTLSETITNYFWIPLAVLIAGLFTALLSKYGYREVEGPGISYLIELKNKKKEIPARTILTRFASSGISLG
jgi:H+/Cl- antiporter ClcA